MLDSLVYGKYRYISCLRQTAGAKELLQADQYPGRTVGPHVDPIDEIRPRQVELLFWNRLALMRQQTLGLTPEYFLNSPAHDFLPFKASNNSLSPIQETEYQGENNADENRSAEGEVEVEIAPLVEAAVSRRAPSTRLPLPAGE